MQIVGGCDALRAAPVPRLQCRWEHRSTASSTPRRKLRREESKRINPSIVYRLEKSATAQGRTRFSTRDSKREASEPVTCCADTRKRKAAEYKEETSREW